LVFLVVLVFCVASITLNPWLQADFCTVDIRAATVVYCNNFKFSTNLNEKLYAEMQRQRMSALRLFITTSRVECPLLCQWFEEPEVLKCKMTWAPPAAPSWKPRRQDVFLYKRKQQQLEEASMTPTWTVTPTDERANYALDELERCAAQGMSPAFLQHARSVCMRIFSADISFNPAENAQRPVPRAPGHGPLQLERESASAPQQGVTVATPTNELAPRMMVSRMSQLRELTLEAASCTVARSALSADTVMEKV
jgi:hypothetical protein